MGATVNQMRVFVAVVDEGGFAFAADALGMSQSSASHTLATLERHLGMMLVNRSPVCLTPDGARLLPHARATVAAADAFESAAISRPQANGTIRFGITPTAGYRLAPALLKLWRRHAPHLRVRLLEGDDREIADWLSTGAVDLAVLIDPEHAAGVVVARDEFRAVVRVDHPLAAAGPLRLVDLLEDPLLVSGAGCEPQITELHRVASVPYRPTQRVRELTTLMSMVDSGLGVTIMPTLAEAMLPDSLTMVPLAHSLERTLVLAGPQGRPWHPIAEFLRDVTRTEFPQPS